MATNDNTLKPNELGTVYDPVNIKIMEVDRFIYTNHIEPVTSTLVLEPSTNNFNEDGLYSERIFGYVGSPERMLKFGYIDLNTEIFNPKIFKLIVQLGSLYKDIMSGQAYAVFDPVSKDFVRVTGDPSTNYDCGTGFSFFLKHFRELTFRKTVSSLRDDRIDVIKKYNKDATMFRYLVEPAGLRDIVNDSSGRLIQDDINKLYTSLMLYTRSIPKGSQSPLYDPVRYQIQNKAQEIFEYIENFLDGKRGFIQGSFARRKVACSTRNVITAAPLIASSPEDPQLLKADEVMMGVYQAIKGWQPAVKHAWYTLFTAPIFKTEAATNVALSDPKTGKLVYTTINPSERDKWTSSDGVDDLINSFRNTDLRKKPMLIKDVDGKDYALLLVYDEGREIALCRSIDDLRDRWPRPIDKTKLRPLTYIEAFYLIADTVSIGKKSVVTRYPVIEQGSAYVADVHIVSTTPSRVVSVIDLMSPDLPPFTLKQYPVIGKSYMDAMMVHPSKLAALGGD